MAEKKDVSKQTIVVLVFLAILVTLLGTLTVMSEISKVNLAAPINNENQQTQGTVKLKIVNPGEIIADSASGRVTLEIRQPNT